MSPLIELLYLSAKTGGIIPAFPSLGLSSLSVAGSILPVTVNVWSGLSKGDINEWASSKYFLIVCVCTVRPYIRAGIFNKSMGARHRGGIGFSYRPARLHRLAEFIPWNQFQGPINI
jgi:hypothetical protein